ncbi:hypothetical protein ACFXKJ_02815 [Kitasatospora indigofera]|uniref:hypothetical protein n=1 Tax=Kitasatospora indigofera TaxID=67307 RepID=UPI00368201A6
MKRLTRGTAVLVRRYRIWLWADGAKAGCARIAGGLALGGFTAGICLAAPVLLVPIAGGWCLAAIVATRPTQPGDHVADSRRVMPREQATAFMVRRARDLIGDATGVHLGVLLDALVEDRVTLLSDRRPIPSPTVADLRRDLEGRGIRVRDSLKVSGTTRVGVHRDDLPAPSGPPPLTPSERGPVVGSSAGQPGTTPYNYLEDCPQL